MFRSSYASDRELQFHDRGEGWGEEDRVNPRQDGRVVHGIVRDTARWWH